MALTERGKVQDGGIVFPVPLSLPDGTDVVVHIEPSLPEDQGLPNKKQELSTEDFLSLPFFGMWADRDDMEDSAAWVQRERQKWRQRSQPQD